MGLSGIANGIGGSIAMADPNKQKDIETGVAITQGILGGLGNLADAYFASK